MKLALLWHRDDLQLLDREVVNIGDAAGPQRLVPPERLRMRVVVDGDTVGQVQSQHLQDARRELSVRVPVDPLTRDVPVLVQPGVGPKVRLVPAGPSKGSGASMLSKILRTCCSIQVCHSRGLASAHCVAMFQNPNCLPLASIA